MASLLLSMRRVLVENGSVMFRYRDVRVMLG